MHSVAYKISIMQIIIVLLDDITWNDGDGRTVFLDDLNPWDSIWSVMERIEEEEGIPTEYQYWFFGGQELGTLGTLAEFNIMDQSVIYLYQGITY